MAATPRFPSMTLAGAEVALFNDPERKRWGDMDESQKMDVVLRVERRASHLAEHMVVNPHKAEVLRAVFKACTPNDTRLTRGIVIDLVRRGRRLLLAPSVAEIDMLRAKIADHAALAARAREGVAVLDLRAQADAVIGAGRTVAMENVRIFVVRLFLAQQRLVRLQALLACSQNLNDLPPLEADEGVIDADVDDPEAPDAMVMQVLFGWPV